MESSAWKTVGVIVCAVVLPSSGHFLVRQQLRGLTLVAWMVILGLVTDQFAERDISILGRYAGGFAVWALSVVDAARLAANRFSGSGARHHTIA